MFDGVAAVGRCELALCQKLVPPASTVAVAAASYVGVVQDCFGRADAFCAAPPAAYAAGDYCLERLQHVQGDPAHLLHPLQPACAALWLKDTLLRWHCWGSA